MKKTLLSIALFAITLGVSAQYVTDFESPVLLPDTSWFGQDQVVYGDTITYHDGTNGGQLAFNTSYDTTSWGYSWSGFAISNITDISTQGFANQFSCINGEGAGGTSQYLISYGTGNKIFHDNDGMAIASMYITNSTYAYHSMKNGDAFAKKFGEPLDAMGNNDGTNGEDWLLLTIYALDHDSLRTGDSVNFYLADYRFADDEDDYIVEDWTEVYLNDIAYGQKGLEFVLTSSDNTGGWMNTPNYFALDRINSWPLESINESSLKAPRIYPNPTNDLLNFEILNQEYSSVDIYNISGVKMKTMNVVNGLNTIDLAEFGKGMYVLSFNGISAYSTERVIVK